MMKNSSRSHDEGFMLEVYQVCRHKKEDGIMTFFLIEVVILVAIFGVLYAMFQFAGRS